MSLKFASIFRSVVLLPLSIIYYYLSSLYTANRTFTQSQFATIFRKIPLRCINLFRKSTPSDTTITPSELDGV